MFIGVPILKYIKVSDVKYESLYRISVVVLLFYIHGKHLRSCRDGQLT